MTRVASPSGVKRDLDLAAARRVRSSCHVAADAASSTHEAVGGSQASTSPHTRSLPSTPTSTSGLPARGSMTTLSSSAAPMLVAARPPAVEALGEDDEGALGRRLDGDLAAHRGVRCLHGGCLLRGVLDRLLEGGQGLQSRTRRSRRAARRSPPRVELVQPSRALGAVRDQAGVLEHFQVLRHGRAADGELRRRARRRRVGPCGQALEDRPARRISERVHSVSH